VLPDAFDADDLFHGLLSNWDCFAPPKKAKQLFALHQKVEREKQRK
jgi:hypothetical protein